MSEWADTYRRLPSKTSAEPGRWRTGKAPYQKEIMDAISDISVRKIVVKTAAQIGKTDAAILNPLGYYIHYDPAPILVMMPTLKMAESLSKERIAPMIQDTPVLRERIDEGGRDSGNTIMQKIFPGGHVTLIGSNSATDLSSRPIRVLLADEIDRYPVSVGEEGDPLLLAEKRLTTFWNRKIVYTSTPTVKGISKIEKEYEHSTQEVWNVPCPVCGELTPLEWEYIKYDKENLEEIHHICPHCGVVSGEQEWKERFPEGKFIAGFPERKVRGFYLNAFASNFVQWRDVVEKFIYANEQKKIGNLEPLKSWTNTEMGQVWEEEGDQLEAEDLYARRENYNCEAPEKVLVLTAGIDVQDDRFELEVVGWGEGKESWGIQYHVIAGDMKTDEPWNRLDEFLSRTFQRADGSVLSISFVFMDSGGHFPNEVCRFCKTRTARRIFPIKGKGGMDVPYISRPTRNNKEKALMYSIGVDTGKALLMQRLQHTKNATEDGPNVCHFPKEEDRGYTLDYFKGLTCEMMTTTYRQGRAVFAWKHKPNTTRRNEPWDCRNYATAALEAFRPTLKKAEDHNNIAALLNQSGRRRGKGIEV